MQDRGTILRFFALQEIRAWGITRHRRVITNPLPGVAGQSVAVAPCRLGAGVVASWVGQSVRASVAGSLHQPRNPKGRRRRNPPHPRKKRTTPGRVRLRMLYESPNLTRFAGQIMGALWRASRWRSTKPGGALWRARLSANYHGAGWWT